MSIKHFRTAARDKTVIKKAVKLPCVSHNSITLKLLMRYKVTQKI